MDVPNESKGDNVGRDELLRRTRRLETDSTAPRVAPGAVAVWAKPDGTIYLVTGAKDGTTWGVQLARV